MDAVTAIKEFGLPLGMLMIAVTGLIHSIRVILKGDLVVARWQFDLVVKDRDEWKAEARRGTALAEKTLERTLDQVDPKLRKALQ